MNLLLLTNGVLTVVFCVWLLKNDDRKFEWTHFNLLCYPALVNVCELFIQKRKISEKLNDSKAMIVEI
jgi:hypothetical protein